MLDLSSIPDDVLLARGMYSTVRAAHEDAKKDLSKLAGFLQSIAGQVLRQMQPDNDSIPENVDSLIASARNKLDEMEAVAKNIESLAEQRAELKRRAWAAI